MGIMLGNLSINDIQARLGVDLPPELVDYLSTRRQEEASNIQPGKWHCFDMPFIVVCGDQATAAEIHRHLAPLAKQVKTCIQIGHR